MLSSWPPGNLPLVVGAEGLNDPHGLFLRPSLAGRMKASVMASLTVPGFSLLEQWRLREGLKAETSCIHYHPSLECKPSEGRDHLYFIP